MSIEIGELHTLKLPPTRLTVHTVCIQILLTTKNIADVQIERDLEVNSGSEIDEEEVIIYMY